MSKVKDFIEGNVNYIKDQLNILPADFKQVVEDRLEVCLNCPIMDGTKCSRSRYEEKDEVKKHGCGCKFPQLAFAPEKQCPLSKWK